MWDSTEVLYMRGKNQAFLENQHHSSDFSLIQIRCPRAAKWWRLNCSAFTVHPRCIRNSKTWQSPTWDDQ